MQIFGLKFDLIINDLILILLQLKHNVTFGMLKLIY